MSTRIIAAIGILLAVVVFLSVSSLIPPVAGQGTGSTSKDVLPKTEAGHPEQVPACHEVWMAVGTDGQAGSGGVTDPLDASSVEKFNALFAKFAKDYGDNLTIHLGPGVFYGDRLIFPRNNWKIRGAGRDVTIIRTRPDEKAFETVGFRADEANGGLTGVEVSDITFDFNVPKLRKANRVFVFAEGKTPRVYYQYVQSPPAWSDKQAYKRETDGVVAYKGEEYVCVAPSQGKEPAQNEFWSILRPCDTSNMPAWEKDKPYAVGDAVSAAGKGFICVAAGGKASPDQDAEHWRAVRADAPIRGFTRTRCSSTGERRAAATG